MPDHQKIEVVTSIKEINHLRTFWQSKQKLPSADFEFFNLIVHTRSNIISPCILTLKKNNELVALLLGRIESTKIPIRFGYNVIAKIPIRQIVFVAGGYIGETNEDNFVSLVSLLSKISKERRIHFTVFESIKDNSPTDQLIYNYFSRSKYRVLVHSQKHWFLELPLTWDDYLKRYKAKQRYWIKRLPRVLDRNFNGNWKIRHYSSLESLREFIDHAEDIASKTYHRALNVGFKKNKETVKRLNLQASGGLLKGYILFIGEAPKAFWYCHIYNNTLYPSATGYDPDFRKYELGTILLMKILEDHCGTVIKDIDFGLGDAQYKKKFGTDFFIEQTIKISSKSLSGLFLFILVKSIFTINIVAEHILDYLQIKQKVKTYWRRRLKQ